MRMHFEAKNDEKNSGTGFPNIALNIFVFVKLDKHDQSDDQNNCQIS